MTSSTRGRSLGEAGPPASPGFCRGDHDEHVGELLAALLLLAWGLGSLLGPLVFGLRVGGLLAEAGSSLAGRAAVYVQVLGAVTGLTLALLSLLAGGALLCRRGWVRPRLRALLGLLVAFNLLLVLLPALTHFPLLLRSPLSLFYNAPGVLYTLVGALGGAGAAWLLRGFLAAGGPAAALHLVVWTGFVRLGVRLVSAPADLSILTYLWRPASALPATVLGLTLLAALAAYLAPVFLRRRPGWAGALVATALLAAVARLALNQALPLSFPHTAAGTLMHANQLVSATAESAEYLILFWALARFGLPRTRR